MKEPKEIPVKLLSFWDNAKKSHEEGIISMLSDIENMEKQIKLNKHALELIEKNLK
jgi:hypothetical protein